MRSQTVLQGEGLSKVNMAKTYTGVQREKNRQVGEHQQQSTIRYNNIQQHTPAPANDVIGESDASHAVAKFRLR